jgi:hypothetical protein
VRLEPDADVADDATVSRLVERPLTADATGALLERCDAEQASLMGAVTAAALVAVREDIAARGGPAAPTIACQSTVDVRRMLRPRVSRREVGLFASGVVTMQQVAADASFWDLARGASARYRDAVFRGEHFVGIPLGRAVQRMLDRRPGDTPSHYMALMRRMSPAAFAVSVMSGQPIERERIGDFELLDVGGLTGLSWLGPMLLAADRVGERLRLGLVHAEPVLARERAVALAGRMGTALETAAGVPAGASAAA